MDVQWWTDPDGLCAQARKGKRNKGGEAMHGTASVQEDGVCNFLSVMKRPKRAATLGNSVL